MRARLDGLESVPADILPKYPCNVVPSNIAIEFDLHGPCLMIPTACAAGNYAIGYGFDMIRTGRTDLMLAGGADPFSRITYMGFARLGAIAPERCQPFDKNRKGMVPGEGAAVLVLEPLEAAQARGATIYAEVLGYGVSCDSHHMTAAHPQGDGAIRAMAMALKESGRSHRRRGLHQRPRHRHSDQRPRGIDRRAHAVRRTRAAGAR